MASINAQPTGAPQSTGAAPSEADNPVNKRTAIGLSSRRSTAPESVQRPPSAGVSMSAWWLVFGMIVLLIAVMLLIAARSLQPDATWNDVAAAIGRPVAPSAAPFLQDDFTTDRGLLKAFAEPGVAAAQVLPAEGVYRLDVWPGFLAWSSINVEGVAALMLSTQATIAAQTPDAAAALIGRFTDEGNFYLFTVDGQGRFGAVRYADGVASELRPPTPLPALNPAGQPNQLTLEDNGAALRFLGNGILLENIEVASSRAQRLGIGALATKDDLVTVTFDTLRVYEP
jgi:hypothetical protein